jgi:hypothetical protein
MWMWMWIVAPVAVKLAEFGWELCERDVPSAFDTGFV